MPLYSAAGKRLFDICISSFFLVLFAPLMSIIAVAVRFTLGSPVLLRQTRIGRDERPFTILKFRTMAHARNEDGNLHDGLDRMSRFGRFLRLTSLDELPQLFNVLSGQMSLVGPRPLYVHYLPHYRSRERRRHDVRPGFTGLAQISGRATLGWDQRLELDVQYVEQLSLHNDLSILYQTVRKALMRDANLAAPRAHQTPLHEERAIEW